VRLIQFKMWHSTSVYSVLPIHDVCIAKGTVSKTNRWIGLLWHGSFIIKGMVDRHHVGQSKSRMSQVFNAVHPSHSCGSLPPHLAAFPVCGWSVCMHRLTQSYTKAYRATDTKTNGQVGVATSSSLRRLHRGRVVWLTIISEYYVHGQTN